MGLLKINTLKHKKNKKSKKDTKPIRRGINMTEEQKALAEKIKQDILDLSKEGFSVRAITAYYNDTFGIKNSSGEIVGDVISRETIRKIICNEEVSLKSILKNPNFLKM